MAMHATAVLESHAETSRLAWLALALTPGLGTYAGSVARWRIAGDAARIFDIAAYRA